MKQGKPKTLDEYIYIRLPAEVKRKIELMAEIDGSNMTIWVRQLIMRELSKNPAGGAHQSN